jgi:hypothetical protein
MAQLQSQDREAATKLIAKVVSKLQSENMAANVQAQTLALNRPDDFQPGWWARTQRNILSGPNEHGN